MIHLSSNMSKTKQYISHMHDKIIEKSKGHFITEHGVVIFYEKKCRKCSWREASKIFQNYNQ